jgi:cobyrinic acid a,c-diamide synthase
MQVAAPRILIAGTASGVGKTTLTCGLLRLLDRRGLKVQAAKCGPDYLDPMMHTRVLGVPSRNLDLFFAGEDLVRELVAEGARTADITVIEGAMGYYDGIAQGHDASAYDLARAAQMPAVLVVDGRGRALSVAAEVAGFKHFRDPSHVVGVILSRVSKGYYPTMKALVERETGVRVLGYVPELAGAGLMSRHLGLVAAGEVADLNQRVDLIADALEQTIDVDGLLALAHEAPDLVYQPRELPERCSGAPTIAVAFDEAFNFYYEDTLALLERLGAQLVRFSPLEDRHLPEGTSGLYLGGGYPELHAERLSANESLRVEIREAIAAGMPTVAECGGFMYLHESLEDADGASWPMVGAVPGRSFGLGRLGRFGYVTLTARRDSLLANAGESLPAHEFHYWDSDQPGDAFHAQKPQSLRGWDCVVATPTLHAGYPHLYLAACPEAARRFVVACAAYASVGKAGCP